MAKKTDKTAVDRAADLSDEVLESLEAAQRKAIKAVRKFAETVDEAMPTLGEGPSRGETVLDAALDMADNFVTTQYEFLRTVVRSTDDTVGTPEAMQLIEKLRRRVSTSAGTFEVYQDKAGKYRFRLRDGEGQILAVGEANASKAACLDEIEAIKTNAPGAAVVDAEG